MSSSGHLALVPSLLGWPYAELPGNVRKSFEVALHLGSVPALALAAARGPRPDLPGLALTLAPAAIVGLAFERTIESRLGSPRAVALAQVVAGALLVAADARPQTRTRPSRTDHLAVGLAQAGALVPGVSRSGAAISVLRVRGLSRDASFSLALAAALPVTLAAGLLKGVRLARNPPPGLTGPLLAGAAAAGASALAALPLTRRPPSLRALGAYRVLLGAAYRLRGPS